jgi:hypothetical protein
MPEMQEDSAPGRHLPWGFVLDPAANARALGDVPQRGLQAARELADRVISTIDTGDRADTGGPRNRASTAAAGTTDPIGELLRAWSEVAASTLAALTAGGGPRPPGSGPEGGRITVDANGQGPPTTWSVLLDQDGQLLAPELWLCNSLPHSVGPLELRLTGLSSSTGAPAGAHRLLPDPDTVELPARSAAAVAMRLVGAEPLEPGVYRGVLEAEGVPTLGVTLELTVVDPHP